MKPITSLPSKPSSNIIKNCNKLNIPITEKKEVLYI